MFKKQLNITIIIMAFFSLSGIMNSQTDEKVKKENYLIVYLSRTHNTETVAKMIHKKVGGKITALALENPYPENYSKIVEQVANENETGYLPPLATKIHIASFNTIFIGFPTWGMQLPPPMKTFLNENDFTGKTIIPFNTNAGYGVGSSLETIQSLCPNSTILKAFSVKGGIERDGILFVMEGKKAEQVNDKIEDWLEELKLLN